MTDAVKSVDPGNRERLLDAAAQLIEASPGDDLSLRAVCALVGVRMPTLYHYFGSKQGLIDAVTARGFDRYLALKAEQPASADPIQDIRAGWDQHVEFGLASPAIYALMWDVVPNRRTPAATLAIAELLKQTRRAEQLGRLAVTAEEAADHVLSSCVGVTLFLITASDRPARLSGQIREATLAAITGAVPTEDGESAAGLADRLAGALRRSPNMGLGPEESALLARWLREMARGPS